MTVASKLHARDSATRKRLFPHSPAFIAPRLPPPRTHGERAARSLLQERAGERVYMLHVYDVVELMERAYAAGVAASKETP